MNLKMGVNFNGIHQAILKACVSIHPIMDRTGQFTVTAALDGKHMATSLHYSGRAIDIRSKHIPSSIGKRKVLDDMRAVLGPDYDVIIEAEGKDNEHYHLEYQPKA